jgi:hypothetical protein
MIVIILFILVLLILLGLVAAHLYRAAEEKRVERAWQSLTVQPSAEVFAPATVADLPEPARRYLLHAIQPGTPLGSSAHLTMRGEFRTKPGAPWRPMATEQLLVPSRGFVWKARMGSGLAWIEGADYYADGRGMMNFRLWGLLPIARAQGPDIDKSALGRLAIEALWVPSCLLPQRGARWEAVDDVSAKVIRVVHGEQFQLTLSFDAEGRLVHAVVPRWGDLREKGRFEFIPLGGQSHEERTFAGYTIPSKLGAGWWFGEDRYFEFFRVTIESARFD